MQGQSSSDLLRLPDQKIQGEIAGDSLVDCQRLIDVPTIVCHDDQEVYVAVIPCRSVSVGSEEDNALRSKLPSNSVGVSTDVLELHHMDTVHRPGGSGKTCLLPEFLARRKEIDGPLSVW